MKKRIKSKWLAALRSGKYKKGKKCLRRPPGIEQTCETYCCLGVLCDLKDSKQWKYNSASDMYEHDSYCGMLSHNNRKWAGLNQQQCSDLADLNDNRETWRSVIRYIEEKL